MKIKNCSRTLCIRKNENRVFFYFLFYLECLLVNRIAEGCGKCICHSFTSCRLQLIRRLYMFPKWPVPTYYTFNVSEPDVCCLLSVRAASLQLRFCWDRLNRDNISGTQLTSLLFQKMEMEGAFLRAVCTFWSSTFSLTPADVLLPPLFSFLALITVLRTLVLIFRLTRSLLSVF